MGHAEGAATFQTPAEAYDRHIGRYGRELARALVDAADLQPAHHCSTWAAGPAP